MGSVWAGPHHSLQNTQCSSLGLWWFPVGKMPCSPPLLTSLSLKHWLSIRPVTSPYGFCLFSMPSTQNPEIDALRDIHIKALICRGIGHWFMELEGNFRSCRNLSWKLALQLLFLRHTSPGSSCCSQLWVNPVFSLSSHSSLSLWVFTYLNTE